MAVVEPGVPAYGRLLVGDAIEAVDGKECHDDMNDVLRAIIESVGDVISLRVCRPPVVVVLRHELQMKDDGGAWQYVMATLTSNRQLLYESPKAADDRPTGGGGGGGGGGGEEVEDEDEEVGEINLHAVASLEMRAASGEDHASLTIAMVDAVEYNLRAYNRVQPALRAARRRGRRGGDGGAALVARADA